MFKLFHKKLNKKGFTLAELLVVVAIIAILVAIAIPIFTGAMKDAQLRVNQAAVRSVKAAGVTEILSNWETNKNTSSWIASAEVSNKGDIVKLQILPPSTTLATSDYAKIGSATYSTDENSAFAKEIAPYNVLVHIDSLTNESSSAS